MTESELTLRVRDAGSLGQTAPRCPSRTESPRVARCPQGRSIAYAGHPLIASCRAHARVDMSITESCAIRALAIPAGEKIPAAHTALADEAQMMDAAQQLLVAGPLLLVHPSPHAVSAATVGVNNHQLPHDQGMHKLGRRSRAQVGRRHVAAPSRGLVGRARVAGPSDASGLGCRANGCNGSVQVDLMPPVVAATVVRR